MNSHKYKIGKKVRVLRTGIDFYIVGVKSYVFPFSGTSLLLHENKNVPSRLGFYKSPSQVEVLDDH